MTNLGRYFMPAHLKILAHLSVPATLLTFHVAIPAIFFTSSSPTYHIPYTRRARTQHTISLKFLTHHAGTYHPRHTRPNILIGTCTSRLLHPPARKFKRRSNTMAFDKLGIPGTRATGHPAIANRTALTVVSSRVVAVRSMPCHPPALRGTT